MTKLRGEEQHSTKGQRADRDNKAGKKRLVLSRYRKGGAYNGRDIKKSLVYETETIDSKYGEEGQNIFSPKSNRGEQA